MCGIAGRISTQQGFDRTIKTGAALSEDCLVARNALKRRGPDQRGIWQGGGAELIHTRLSVIDLEHGLQPMTLDYQGKNGKETYILVYNGELYNAAELRRELTVLGHSFTEQSDTEVLLHAYAEWLGDCVERLNGIFAFAVWEVKAQRLFIARDRIGVKPFFFSLRRLGANESEFIFGSEIKALLALGIEPAIDQNGVAELVLLAPGRTPGYGVFKGVEELKPGYRGYFDAGKNGGKLDIHRYWQLTDKPHTDNLADTVDNVRSLVLDAITRQLASDVPVCTFLSGGLDSSAISSVAAKELGTELHTFSVDYADNDKYFQASKFQPNSDADFIRKMNVFLGGGVTHHNIILHTTELANALYAAVDARDLPGMADVDSSLLLFCREIKKHATVALSGECADEIFGGYPWYRDPEVRAVDGFPWAQSTAYRATFLNEEFIGTNPTDLANAFVDNRYRQTLTDTDILPGLNAEERRLRQMTRLNFDWFMQTLLDRKDRMSMYSGLEVRVPFCDHRIAEYLYSVPWEFKDLQGREKGLLREALKGLLPDEVLWRKKSPYPKTHNPSYLRLVSERLGYVIADPSAPLLHIVSKSALTALLNGESSQSVPWYGQLMTRPQTIAYFLQLNYWLEKYNVKIV